MNKNSLTEHHLRIINILIQSEWAGASLFAKNILAQGWCSSKQENAMFNILRSINQRKLKQYFYGNKNKKRNRFEDRFEDSLDHDDMIDYTGEHSSPYF